MDEILAKLNAWLHRKESEKFTTDGSGNTAVRVEGNISLDSADTLDTEGRITKITLDDTTWVALERSGTTEPIGSGALVERGSLTLQNRTKKDILLQYDNTETDVSISMVLKGGSERFYDIKNPITVYARSSSGSGELIIEELS